MYNRQVVLPQNGRAFFFFLFFSSLLCTPGMVLVLMLLKKQRKGKYQITSLHSLFAKILQKVFIWLPHCLPITFHLPHAIQPKECFPTILFIILYNMLQTSESVDEIQLSYAGFSQYFPLLSSNSTLSCF